MPSRNAANSNGALGWLVAFSALSSVLVPGAGWTVVFPILANLGAVALALSPIGRELRTLPERWLIGFQAFRLPLELVLHAWVLAGSIPPQMTWTGRNWDIATGILAVLLVVRKTPAPRALVWVFEVVGLGLLGNVAFVAVRSIPGPLKDFEGDPLLLPFNLPYAWIVPVCVAGALLGHLILLRRLLDPPPAITPPPAPPRFTKGGRGRR
jgi:hypothetical protein